MHIFTRLPEGATFLGQFTAASAAQHNLLISDGEAAVAVCADARNTPVLPAFGMVPKLQRTGSSPKHPYSRSVDAWVCDYPFPHFWADFTRTLFGALHTARTDDGLIQTLSAAGAAEVWDLAVRRAYSRASGWSPTPAHQPLHFAAAIASFGGLPWQITDDGIARALPNQPFRHIPRGAAVNPPVMHGKQGLLNPCVGWAVIPAHTLSNSEGEDALVYFAGVGQQKKLRATWAQLLDARRETIKLPFYEEGYYDQKIAYRAARRPAGKQVYQTFWNDTPLPESGLAHMVMQHWSIFAPRALEPFIHLTGADGIPDLTRFMTQMDAACPLPLTPAWAAQLWELGVSRTCILPLPSYGCTAYFVDPSDVMSWGQIVARCLGHDAATFTTVGAPVADASAAADLIVPVDELIDTDDEA